jgi:hypothetical protein
MYMINVSMIFRLDQESPAIAIASSEHAFELLGFLMATTHSYDSNASSMLYHIGLVLQSMPTTSIAGNNKYPSHVKKPSMSFTMPKLMQITCPR